jgi:hypothetical protein
MLSAARASPHCLREMRPEPWMTDRRTFCAVGPSRVEEKFTYPHLSINPGARGLPLPARDERLQNNDYIQTGVRSGRNPSAVLREYITSKASPLAMRPK